MIDPVQPHAGKSEAPSAKLNLTLVLEAIQYRWKLPIILMVLVPIMGIGARYLIKPKVKMSAQLLFQDKRRNPIVADLMSQMPVANRVPLITAVVHSGPTLTRVLTKIGEVDENTPLPKLEREIVALRAKITIWGEGGGLVRVSVLGHSPDRVHAILSALTESAIEELGAPQRAGLDKSVQFIEAQLKRVQLELSQLQDKVSKFKGENSRSLPEVYRHNVERRDSLSKDQIEAETELKGAEEELRLAEQRLLRYDPESKKMREKLAGLHKQLRQLKKTYTERHPKVRALANAIETLDGRLTDRHKAKVVVNMTEPDVELEEDPEPGEEADPSAEKDVAEPSAHIIINAENVLAADLQAYEKASSSVASFTHKLGRVTEQLVNAEKLVESYASNEQELNGLLRDLDAKSKVYVTLLQRFEEAQVTRELAKQEAGKQLWVVDKPSSPTTVGAVSPILILLLGPFGGLALSIVLIGFLEFLDPTVRSREEAARLASAPALGTLPWMGDNQVL